MTNAQAGNPGAMRAQATSTTTQYARTAPPMSGWRMFSGIMILIAATWNIIDGLIAVLNANYYQNVANAVNIELPITNEIETWGWVALALGALLLVVAFGVFADQTWATVTGVIVVGLNMIFHFGFLAAFPGWSLAAIALDALIIYGLVVPTQQSSTGTPKAAM